MDGPDALVLRTHRGRPTEHARIPVSVGICGRAAREKRTVIVDDVTADPSYLACSLETRSEIVVPIMKGDRVFGEIDIDGDAAAAYGPADERFLEEVAALIAKRVRRAGVPAWPGGRSGRDAAPRVRLCEEGPVARDPGVQSTPVPPRGTACVGLGAQRQASRRSPGR